MSNVVKFPFVYSFARTYLHTSFQFSFAYLGNLERVIFVARKYGSVIRRNPSFEQILIE